MDQVDDLKVSDRLVHGLSLSEQTKQFVFAIHEPESQAVVYVLAAQSLSKQAALDAECLIKEVKPEAVVAQISHLPTEEIAAEGDKSRDDLVNSLPTSSFGVLKDCIFNRKNKEMYDNVAGNLVLQEIFGIGFHGHLWAAKRAAKEVGSSFLLFRSPLVIANGNICNVFDTRNKFQGVGPLHCSFTSEEIGSIPLSTDEFQLQMLKSLSSSATCLNSTSYSCFSGVELEDPLPRCNYQAPPFAQPIYPLLCDLHNLFNDLQSIGSALHKVLINVDKGETVDSKLSEVQTFRIAVEGLRIALNSAAHCPISKQEIFDSARMDFSQLPMDEKSNVLLARALRHQTKSFKSIVEASSLRGLRKHWKTPIPMEVENLAKQSIYRHDDEEESLAINTVEGKNLTDSPLLAVGAGATAVLGASSIPRVLSISNLTRLITLHVPVSLELLLSYTEMVAAIALGKAFGPTKLVAQGIATYGAKTTSALKAVGSTQKIHAVVHSIIVSVERTSFSIMRTAFNEIMRNRGVKPIGLMLWATFGCSMAMCTGLFVYGDGIECAVESLPAAPQ
ncbi:hypothetical protein CRYUN_Cryun21dG0116300 [Craigia yunnanensis]